jgi:hypothetical protein
MKIFVFFAIIYIVNSIRITSIPINKVYPDPSSSIYSKPSPSPKPSASASMQFRFRSAYASVSARASVTASITPSVIASVSRNATLYKIKLTDNQKIEDTKINVNTEIKKSKINHKYITIFIVFIIMIFGYTSYKYIYVIKNAKTKKVENQLPFYNDNFDNNNNTIYHLQPHSPKNQEQCYRRISSNSSMSNMESF